MDSQLKCKAHNDEDIILIDISKQCDNMNRTYCIECLKNVQLQNTCSIKKLPDMMAQYSEIAMGEISKEYEQLNQKIKKIMKLLDTLKQATIKICDNMFSYLEQKQKQLDATLKQTKDNYKNLTIEMTRTKLEKIANILSGNEEKTTFMPNNTINKDIMDNYKQLEKEQQEIINKIGNELKQKVIQKNADQQVKKINVDPQNIGIRQANQLISTFKTQINYYFRDIQQKFEQEFTESRKIKATELQQESIENKNKEQALNFGGEIIITINELINDGKQTMNNIRETLMHQIKLKSQLKYQNQFLSLQINKENNLVVGGRTSDIVIWQQQQLNLKEICNFKGHTGFITAIVIYQSGDIIVTGGDENDKTIKQWKKQQNQWKCIQTLNDHQDRITDLQLTKNQEQLVSASGDKLIKIWKMKQHNYQLECIQTLNYHYNWVYWVSISQDSMFMASSSYQDYFNIYKNVLNQINPWIKFSTIETKGKIKRVYFTNNDELLVQQENPPILIVYYRNTNNQYQSIQDIILNQPDNTNIFFPIFEMNNTIYLKNDKFIYIIRRLKTGKYFIQQILAQLCAGGCRDCTGEGIILVNQDNLSIDIYK